MSPIRMLAALALVACPAAAERYWSTTTPNTAITIAPTATASTRPRRCVCASVSTSSRAMALPREPRSAMRRICPPIRIQSSRASSRGERVIRCARDDQHHRGDLGRVEQGGQHVGRRGQSNWFSPRWWTVPTAKRSNEIAIGMSSNTRPAVSSRAGLRRRRLAPGRDVPRGVAGTGRSLRPRSRPPRRRAVSRCRSRPGCCRSARAAACPARRRATAGRGTRTRRRSAGTRAGGTGRPEPVAARLRCTPIRARAATSAAVARICGCRSRAPAARRRAPTRPRRAPRAARACRGLAARTPTPSVGCTGRP